MGASGVIVENFIIILSLLLTIGVLTAKFSNRIGVPALVLFILVGMVIGSDGLGIIYFGDYNLSRVIGMLALIIILFDGGLQTKWSTVKPVLKPSFTLATVGVIITSVVVGIGSRFVMGVTWFEALLFGSIVGSTDAAAVFMVLRGKQVRSKIRATLEAESGSNDPMAMILTISFMELIISPQPSYLLLAGSFLWQMGMGFVMGILIGKLATYAINRINLDSSGLYPVFTLAFALLAFSISDYIGASGLLSVYVAAVLIGNSELAYRHSIFRFSDGFAWMAQIMMFTILGLLVFPQQLFTLEIIIQGLLVSVILIVIARPIAVFLCTFKYDFNLNEKIFLAWGGLKGAVPIVLATFPMAAQFENSQGFFNVVFFVVLLSALLQGSTISAFADKLKLTGPKRTEPMHSLELVSIGKANAEMIEYEVADDLAIADTPIAKINFPDDVLVNAIIRDNHLITPSGSTLIKAGDIMFILASRKNKQALKEILEATKPEPDNQVQVEENVDAPKESRTSETSTNRLEEK